MNNVVAMVFTAAGVMVTKEPSTGLSRPDGITLIQWRAGKPVVWDVTMTLYTYPFVCRCINTRGWYSV